MTIETFQTTNLASFGIDNPVNDNAAPFQEAYEVAGTIMGPAPDTFDLNSGWRGARFGFFVLSTLDEVVLPSAPPGGQSGINVTTNFSVFGPVTAATYLGTWLDSPSAMCWARIGTTLRSGLELLSDDDFDPIAGVQQEVSLIDIQNQEGVLQSTTLYESMPITLFVDELDRPTGIPSGQTQYLLSAMIEIFLVVKGSAEISLGAASELPAPFSIRMPQSYAFSAGDEIT